MVRDRFRAAAPYVLVVVSLAAGCATGSEAPNDPNGQELLRADPSDAGADAPPSAAWPTDAGTGTTDARPATDGSTTGTSCTATPWGTVADGFSEKAYESSTPKGACKSEVRICTAGVLSGSFAATTCTPGCEGTPWGSVASGFSGTAYANAAPTFGNTCAATGQVRTCAAGSMSGTYTSISCKNYPCEQNGAYLRTGSAAFASGTYPSTWRECGIDGMWGPAQTGNPTALGTPCEYSGSYYERNSCGYYNAVAYRCSPTGWVADPSCPPGP